MGIYPIAWHGDLPVTTGLILRPRHPVMRQRDAAPCECLAGGPDAECSAFRKGETRLPSCRPTLCAACLGAGPPGTDLSDITR